MRQPLTSYEHPFMRVDILTGDAITPVLQELAALRIRVFHDWPYLYEGSVEYETHYVGKYATTQGAMIAIATDTRTGAIVGASTALPLAQAEDAIQAPFQSTGKDVAAWYYFGESVLLPDYRGMGIGVAFFAAREATAHALGFSKMGFCSVIRPADHPLKPTDYTPLDAFWTKRGYTKHPDMIAQFDWLDRGDTVETTKPLVFWLKEVCHTDA